VHTVVSTTATLENSKNQTITIVKGSSVPLVNNEITLNGISYSILNGSISAPLSFEPRNIISTAYSYLGCPYLWGGRSPFGIDCSGLTQMVFKMVNKLLPRDAWQQALHEGEFIDLIAEAQAGDVAFFDNEEGNIIHVGILTGEGTIIHASGEVRIDSIDHQGIYNQQAKKYTHKLRIIKRFKL
jgi:cell wall-associated NlpC family hydrolase